MWLVHLSVERQRGNKWTGEFHDMRINMMEESDGNKWEENERREERIRGEAWDPEYKTRTRLTGRTRVKWGKEQNSDQEERVLRELDGAIRLRKWAIYEAATFCLRESVKWVSVWRRKRDRNGALSDAKCWLFCRRVQLLVWRALSDCGSTRHKWLHFPQMALTWNQTFVMTHRLKITVCLHLDISLWLP